jgi:hypothetical protein
MYVVQYMPVDFYSTVLANWNLDKSPCTYSRRRWRSRVLKRLYWTWLPTTNEYCRQSRVPLLSSASRTLMGRPQAFLEGRRSVAQGRSKIVERSISTFALTMACDETTKVQPTHNVTSLLTAEAGARAVPKRARARAKAKVTFILFQTVLIHSLC